MESTVPSPPVRVVGGTARARRLVAPTGSVTRPTSDRTRESIFNVLMSLDAVDEATVVDLFAGTGALGIEALSRGAASCTFVERDAKAIDAIKANLEATKVPGQAKVVRSDVLSWVAAGAAADLVFADPPYEFDAWSELVGAVAADLLVLESDREVEVGPRFEVLKVKHYGSTVVTVARRASTAS